MHFPPLLGCHRFAPLALFSLLVTGACSDVDACEKDRNKIKSCNRVFTRDVCGDEASRCGTSCYAALSCAQFAQIDNDIPIPSLSRCLVKCRERLTCGDGTTIPAYWQCDGSQDCVDGSDEKKCKYHTCKSGQLVRAEAVCNGYSECSDESDEEGCP